MSGVSIKRYQVVSSSPGTGSFNQSMHDRDSLMQHPSRTPNSTGHMVTTGQQTAGNYGPIASSPGGPAYPGTTVLTNTAPFGNTASMQQYRTQQANDGALLQPPMASNTFNTRTMREYDPAMDKDARIIGENVIEVASGLPARIVREEPVEFVKEIVREIPKEYIQRTVFQEPVTYIREVTYDEPVLVMEQVVEREPFAYYKRTVENLPGGQYHGTHTMGSGPVMSATSAHAYPGIPVQQGAYPVQTQMMPAPTMGYGATVQPGVQYSSGMQPLQPMQQYQGGTTRIMPMNQLQSKPMTPSNELQISQPPQALLASRGTFGQQLYTSEAARHNSMRT